MKSRLEKQIVLAQLEIVQHYELYIEITTSDNILVGPVHQTFQLIFIMGVSVSISERSMMGSFWSIFLIIALSK